MPGRRSFRRRRKTRRTDRSSTSGRAGTLRNRVEFSRANAVENSPRLRSTRGPRVGIGLTLCNKAAYVREAVDSMLAQSYTDFRLLLLDDGSIDGTEEIAREYAARDP